ncbi:hypothetical protein ACJJTC_000275 [Scirpophaga incertulas]
MVHLVWVCGATGTDKYSSAAPMAPAPKQASPKNSLVSLWGARQLERHKPSLTHVKDKRMQKCQLPPRYAYPMSCTLKQFHLEGEPRAVCARPEVLTADWNTLLGVKLTVKSGIH